jgi:hypothetical protein
MFLSRRDTERKIAETTEFTLSFTDKIAILADLAYWFTNNGLTDADRDRVVNQLRMSLAMMPTAVQDADRLYRYLLIRSGLLREPVAGRVDFVHKTFQEYLRLGDSLTTIPLSYCSPERAMTTSVK